MPRIEPQEPPSIMIFFLLRCLVRNSATSMPSSASCAGSSWLTQLTDRSCHNFVSATLVPLDKREVFLPSREHGIGEWTQGVSRGSPCRKSTTGLLRSSPSIVIH